MDDRPDRSRLETMREVIQTLPLAVEADDGELERIYDIVVEHLERGPAVTAKEPWEHMALHLKDSLAPIMADPRLEPVQERIRTEQAKRAPAGETLGAAAAAGLVVGGIAVYALICVGAAAYCMGGDAPAPGESVEVRC